MKEERPDGKTGLAAELAKCDFKALTSLEAKERLYRVEPYFREAWADWLRTFGESVLAVLQRITLVILLPEAQVGRRAHRCLDYLRGRAFTPVYFRRFRYDDHAIREDWRYQMSNMTLDRMRLATLANTSADSLFVVFRDDSEPLRVPASVRLAALKGPAKPSLRNREHLRSVLGSRNRMIKFIHAADEPADVVRDLGILFDHAARRALLKDLRRDMAGDVTRELRSCIEDVLYRECPSHDLDAARAWGRLLTRVRARQAEGDLAARACQGILAARESCGRGTSPLAWCEFEERVAAAGLAVDLWDLITIGAEHIRHKYEEEEALISSHGGDGWIAGRSKVLDGAKSWSTLARGLGDTREHRDAAPWEPARPGGFDGRIEAGAQ
jgi:hypothetical protein